MKHLHGICYLRREGTLFYNDELWVDSVDSVSEWDLRSQLGGPIKHVCGLCYLRREDTLLYNDELWVDALTKVD